MIAHLALLAVFQQQVPVPAADRSYLFFVASEGTDEVALVRFGPKGLLVEHRTPIRLVPGDPAAPPEIYSPRYLLWDSLQVRTIALSSAHGFSSASLSTYPRELAVTPDARNYFVTTSHGLGGGELVKVRIAADSGWRRQMQSDSVKVVQPPDTLQGREAVTGVPGVIQVTPDGVHAWVTGDATPGDDQPPGVSVVYIASMLEVARIPTCTGARGGRFTADGLHHFSVCTHDDVLVDIDVAAMRVNRRLSLTRDGQSPCRPSAVAVVPDGSRAFVACARSGAVIEVDARAWSVVRQIPIGAGVEALAVSSDGRTLVATNPGAKTVSVVDVGGARPVDVISTGRRAPVGLLVTPDNRYAIFSASGTDADPGAIEVIDLAARARAASLDFARGLAALAFWKVTP